MKKKVMIIGCILLALILSIAIYEQVENNYLIVKYEGWNKVRGNTY